MDMGAGKHYGKRYSAPVDKKVASETGATAVYRARTDLLSSFLAVRCLDLWRS